MRFRYDKQSGMVVPKPEREPELAFEPLPISEGLTDFYKIVSDYKACLIRELYNLES